MSLKRWTDLRDTLSFRLALLYAGIFTLTSLLAFSVFYYRIHSLTMEQVDEELLEEVGEFTGTLAEDGLEGVRMEMDQEILDEEAESIFFRVFTPGGQVLATTDLGPWGDPPVDGDSISEALDGEPVLETVRIPGREYHARVVHAAIGPERVLQIGRVMEDAEDYLQVFRNLFFVLFAAVFILSIFIGRFMGKRALAHVEKVTHTAREISAGAYDRRVDVGRQYLEIRELAETFNRMLDEIQDLIRGMRELNDNVAHDLRSPLTRIRGAAEMALLKETSQEGFQEMAAGIIEECDNLIEIINTMLDITESEAGIMEISSQEFDVGKLASEACEIFRPMAEEKGVAVRMEVADGSMFTGDVGKLQRVLANLLENAIKYSNPGGEVILSASVTDGALHMDVQDNGIGISEIDRPHIFERFYRSETSRYESGIGLGLSLAKAFTEAMGGAISVISDPGSGSVFKVVVPA